ncbi:subtilisin-like protease [Metarhizium rileyi]|uniref:Subtilisin-like protease n=1 Tax=Metarhizium rileyi (strain RCEF 4871) TaxID=1649241 RepID=A0A162M5W9_METRR|nr:subtilisin-like protease [Metarhizium rileyi RCEF 4871]
MVNIKNLILSAAALAGQSLAGERTAAGKYIVTLKLGITSSKFDGHMKWINRIHAQANPGSVYSGVEYLYDGSYGFSGYSGSFDEPTLAEIRSSEDVEAVEQDQVWNLNWIQDESASERESPVAARWETTYTEQKNVTWGLATLSHRYSGAREYSYDSDAGLATYAYVVDTGIRDTHDEFEGRAHKAYSIFDQETDFVGHGTHVAGTIAGKTYGIAKKASIMAVKVFNGTAGLASDLLTGFNWAANDIIRNNRTEKAVINISAGGPASTAFNLAVDRASAHGVTTVSAAGNSGVDASAFSPASAQSSITVAAINSDWERARYTNFGPAVKIFAPGTMVVSASNKDDSSVVAMSGTSMASPHIAGLAIYIMSTQGITRVGPVTQHILSTATKDKVGGGTHGSPNLIGNNNVPGQWD